MDSVCFVFLGSSFVLLDFASFASVVKRLGFIEEKWAREAG